MKTLPPPFVTAALAVTALFAPLASAGTADSYNLDIAAPVQIAGSDAAAAKFLDAMPTFTQVFDKVMTGPEAASYLSAKTLDPNKLTLAKDSTVRIYFINEWAGNANMLGFSTTGPSADGKSLIFPNSSTTAGWGGTDRPGWAPLQPGDFVDIGTFSAGTKLDFFIISDGARGGKEILSTDASANQDGLVHAMSIAPAGSPYLLYGFEDIFGEQISVFNDLFFAVQIIPTGGLGAPEPSLAAGALLAGAAILGASRRRKA